MVMTMNRTASVIPMIAPVESVDLLEGCPIALDPARGAVDHITGHLENELAFRSAATRRADVVA